jgi:hypothetical protein
MKERIEINKPEDVNEPIGRSERREVKKRKVNKWGVYISVIFIVAGLLWYAINMGLIPMEFIKQQAGPILIILLGLLILIKSLSK